MRPGFKWLIALLILGVFVMMVGPPLWAIVFGGGFDP